MKSAVGRAALLGGAVVVLNSPLLGNTGDVAFDGYVAERMALLADHISLLPDTPTAVLRESAALLDLARGLNPNEFRFARQSADVYLRLGDRDRAIDALTAVRRIEPADQLAMIQYIDLVTSKLETAESKVAYLMQVADARGVAPEVQSHAAFKLVDLFYTRGQEAEADDALKKSLQLNSQNLPALKQKYRLAVQAGDAKARVQALIEYMRAAPTDTEAMISLAHEADAVGAQLASGWLRLYGLQIAASRGIAPDVNEALDFAGAQMLAANDESVKSILGQLAELMKEDGRFYALSLLYLQMGGEAIKEDALPMARGVYLAQLAGVSQLLNEPDKKEMPTTNPAVPMPNVRADVAKLKAGDPSGLSPAYAVALAEQLWFDTYFKAAQVDDADIEALGQLIGENDPIIARLQGWKLLAAGKGDEARVKFEAVADRDGFAHLGLIAAHSAANQPDKARQEMSRLLRSRPTGMIAAYTAVMAKRLGVQVDQTPQEREIADLITGIQRYLSEVLTNPRAFYLLTANPDKVSYGFGEPILALVTVLNTGRASITVGSGGMIEPNFLVDAQVRDTSPKVFPGTARGQFTGAVKLKPGQKITQAVRIDRDQLFRFLGSYSTPLWPITAYVTTNPIPEGQVGWKSGAGGQQTKLGKAFERQSAPFFVESYRTKVIEQLSKGSAVQRATTAELFGTVITPMKAQTDNAEAVAVAKTLEDAYTAQFQNESNAEVKSWMQLAYKKDLSEDEWISAMAKSKTMLGQVGAMMSVRHKEKAVRDAIAQLVLDAKPEPAVAEFANALLAQPDLKVEAARDEEVPDSNPPR